MAHPFAAFYRGKRVLVTGHTGFQGGWLVAWLKLLGAQVCGYGLPPTTRPNFFDANILDRGITSIFADLRDRNALAGAFAEFQPEIVIHCALQGDLQLLHNDPVQTFSTDVMGTVHVLEEARQTGSVHALVIATRAGTYKGSGWSRAYGGPHLDASETTCASHACAELATSAYIESFFSGTKTAVAIGRTSDLIGGGDWAGERTIPQAVRAITSDQPLVLHGARTASYQHVLEAAQAYLLLGCKLHEEGKLCSGAWNFTPADCDVMSAEQLIHTFARYWGVELASNSTNEASVNRPAALLDSSPSRTQFGWKPVLALDEAIAWTAEWYRGYYSDPASAGRVTEDQISHYMRMK
jgi:CDP-glucose 4,6-dehydratase